jgi:hypothetical protein
MILKVKLLFALILLPLVGCALLDPAADPLLVRADQSIRSSFSTVNSFLTYCNNNRDFVATIPEVADAGNQLQRTYPAAHDSAWAMRRTYAANKSAENKATLETWLAILDTATEQAQKHLLKLSSAPNAPPVK